MTHIHTQNQWDQKFTTALLNCKSTEWDFFRVQLNNLELKKNYIQTVHLAHHFLNNLVQLDLPKESNLTLFAQGLSIDDSPGGGRISAPPLNLSFYR